MKSELLKPLKPLEAQTALNKLIDHFLGEKWYVADPLGVTQVNAIAVDEILRLYPNPKWAKKRKTRGERA